MAFSPSLSLSLSFFFCSSHARLLCSETDKKIYIETSTNNSYSRHILISLGGINSTGVGEHALARLCWYILILTEEFADDLGSFFGAGKSLPSLVRDQ